MKRGYTKEIWERRERWRKDEKDKGDERAWVEMIVRVEIREIEGRRETWRSDGGIV